MASNKKSIILYCDVIHTIKFLNDEQKGRLFQHLLEYVNDMNPELEDPILQVAFEPIKQALKRDLKKYEQYIDRQRVNGAKGGRPKKTQKSQPFFEKPKKADSVSDSVNDNVNDIYFTHDEFVKWFNDCRKYIGLKSNIAKLSRHEKEDLNELVKHYTKEDFKKAFKSFSKDDYYKSNNLIFPKYFLKEETFTKYLNTEVKELTLGEKLMGKQ